MPPHRPRPRAAGTEAPCRVGGTLPLLPFAVAVLLAAGAAVEFGRLVPERRSRIAAVIAYLKSTWPPFERAWQAAQNPGGTFPVNLPGDWRFPADCGFHDRHPRKR